MSWIEARYTGKITRPIHWTIICFWLRVKSYTERIFPKLKVWKYQYLSQFFNQYIWFVTSLNCTVSASSMLWKTSMIKVVLLHVEHFTKIYFPLVTHHDNWRMQIKTHGKPTCIVHNDMWMSQPKKMVRLLTWTFNIELTKCKNQIFCYWLQ